MVKNYANIMNDVGTLLCENSIYILLNLLNLVRNGVGLPGMSQRKMCLKMYYL